MNRQQTKPHSKANLPIGSIAFLSIDADWQQGRLHSGAIRSHRQISLRDARTHARTGAYAVLIGCAM